MSNTIIKAEDISVKNRLETSSFEIQQGLTVVSGPSGSGKSTCAITLLGLMHPDTGIISHFGLEDRQTVLEVIPKEPQTIVNKLISILKLESEENRKQKAYISRYCGYVAQRPYLPSDMTGRKYVNWVHGARGNDIDQNRFEGIVDSLGISDKIDKLSFQQSGGEQQRMAVAFAIAHKPNLLVADEPTSSLDSESGTKLLDLIRGLVDSEGLSTIWISHDTKTLDYADNVIYVKDGRIHN